MKSDEFSEISSKKLFILMKDNDNKDVMAFILAPILFLEKSRMDR